MYKHENVPTSFKEVNGVRFAYRVLGRPEGVPLVFLNRFRGNMDDWDPELTNGFAASRPVILFDNVGIGLSNGTTPGSVGEMARDAVSFIESVSSGPVDLLGFSVGGYVAQRLTLDYPDRVRKLVLAGTGPGVPAHRAIETVAGGDPARLLPDAALGKWLSRPKIDEATMLAVFFTESESSIAAGKAHWARIHARTGGRAPATIPESYKSQSVAIGLWRNGVDSAFEHLQEIKVPVLVANGDRDLVVPTVNSYIMFERIPNSTLILYPDAGHGFLHQYPALFTEHTNRFLDSELLGAS